MMYTQPCEVVLWRSSRFLGRGLYHRSLGKFDEHSAETGMATLGIAQRCGRQPPEPAERILLRRRRKHDWPHAVSQLDLHLRCREPADGHGGDVVPLRRRWQARGKMQAR